MPRNGEKAGAVLFLTVDCITQETTESVFFSQTDAFYFVLS